MDIEKVKKLIAKEVLLAFGIVVTVAASWGVLLLRNEYYKDQQVAINTKISLITVGLNSFPQDYIKLLYDSLSLDFVVNYKNGDNEYAIPKKEEKEFLSDFTKAVKLPIKEKGYSYFYFSNKNFDIASNQGSWETPLLNSDSSLVFDFVELGEFKKLLQNIDYKKKLFLRLKDEYETGNFNEFDNYIKKGLMYNSITDDKIKFLKEEKIQKQEELLSATSSIWDTNKIKTTFDYIFLVLIILVYPVRICYFLLKWALKTLRT